MINNDDHPDDQGLHASQEDHWGTVKSVPDFSGKITGRNSKENNWEDQRNIDNYYRNAVDIYEAGKHRK